MFTMICNEIQVIENDINEIVDRKGNKVSQDYLSEQ